VKGAKLQPVVPLSGNGINSNKEAKAVYVEFANKIKPNEMIMFWNFVNHAPCGTAKCIFFSNDPAKLVSRGDRWFPSYGGSLFSRIKAYAPVCSYPQLY
jgi:hypothetical protein